MKVNRLDVPVITPPMTPLDLEDSASVMANDVPVDQSVNLKPIYSAVESSDEDDHRWDDLREENAKMRQLARNKDFRVLHARCYGTYTDASPAIVQSNTSVPAAVAKLSPLHGPYCY